MSNKVIVEVEMLDSKKSLDNLDNGAKRVNKTLERTQELMAGTKGGGGSKAAAAAFGQTEYNTARGTVGTGASGRDFAKQSRELDGLVRLYSIYAANIFAAGAAFRALSDAMDTTNMIQGLNQLGAASGVAMGGLAKRFSEASGGAISLRESMEATAKAVSSGLSQAQFLKLGEVAKKASQALGVNMSDAVSRLTRGITKLEPELLDELGIFTKVGQATEDYARKIGKPVAALTDFEKRQAFANAVLAEGAKKFGDIDIPTNPYDKLLATLKNVAQAGLEIVNNVLGPFAKLLSNNTGLLVGVIGLIGAKIVKDALPAIGQWRSSLKDAADAARKSSSDIAASFGEGFVERTNAAFKVPQLEANLKASEEAYRVSRAKMATMDTDFSKRVLKGGAGTDDKSLKSEQSKLTREINKLKTDGLSIDNAQILALEKQKASVVALRNAIKETNAAKNAALDKSESGGGSIFDRAGDFLRGSAAKGARDKSQRLDTLSRVSTTQTQYGFGAAMSVLKKDLGEVPNWLNKARTGIAGVTVAAAGSIGTAVSGLSRYLGPVGIGLGILQAALPLFRNNEESAARFAGSLDLLKENSENSFRVLERLSKLDPLANISVDNILAKGVALESLGGSMSKAFTDIETEIKDRNWADSTTNFLASIIGRSSEQLLAKQIGNTVERAVQLSANGPNGKVVQEQLIELLKLPANASTNAIKEALKDASPAIQQAASKIIEDSGKKAVASAGSFKSFKEGLLESGKIYQDLINTTKNSTPLTKFAEDSSKKIIELAKTMANSQLPEKLTTLRDLSTDINFLQLFPPQVAKNILSTSSELTNLSTELADVEFRQTEYNKALNEQQKIVEQFAGRREGSISNLFGDADKFATAKDAIVTLNRELGKLQTTKSTIGTGLESASLKFTNSMRLGLIANIDTFTQGLVDATARGALEIKKTALGGIADPRLKVQVSQDIDLKTIALDRKLLETQMNLIDSNSELRLAIMENTFSQKLDKAGIKGTPEEIVSQLNLSENSSLLEERRSITAFKDNKGKSSAALRKGLKDEGLSSGVMQGMGEAIGQAQAREALKAQMAALDKKGAGRELQGKLEGIDANKEVILKNLGNLQKDIDQEQLKFAEKKDQMSDAEFKAANQVFLVRKADAENAARIVEASAAVQKAQEITGVLSTKESKQNLDYTYKALEITTKQSLTERELAISAGSRGAEIAKAVEDKNKELKAADQLAIVNAASIDLQLSKNKIAQDELTLQDQLGMIDSQSLKLQMDDLKLKEAKLEQIKQLTAAQVAYNQEIGKLDLAKVSAGGVLTGEKAAEDATARASLLQNYKDQVTGIKSVTDAAIANAQIMKDTTDRQLAYTDLFKQAFKGMEDAIVEFTKTGKLNFKSMIASFLEGLLRFEIQQQQMAMFKSMNGAGGMANMFMKFLGVGGTSAPTGPGFIPNNDAGITSLFANVGANGLVYGSSGRIDKFAMGGAFSNSIVTSPTLFKFAQGTGLMGEAGPEAIMPLKRDSSGSLGVVNNGGGGNVDVVVNNFSTEKATAKETVDSRGNRKIEVTVGDMVADQLSRHGSSAQRALTSNYGQRPMLVRR